MPIRLILLLRQAGFAVGLHELLGLYELLLSGLTSSYAEFRILCRSICVKHEHQLERFDVVFDGLWKEIQENEPFTIPEEWLRPDLQRSLTEEEKAKLEAFGSLEDLQKRFQELLDEQNERHACGDTWIGTGGTSPFGAFGHNPAGFRIGQHGSRNRTAIKKLDQDLLPPDETEEVLQSRHFQLALRQLRQLARDGRKQVFDLKKTIQKTSRNAGMLDLQFSLAREHHARLILLLDWGGSMRTHARLSRQLAEAARSEFKDIQLYYFRNCPYEYLWTSPNRLNSERITTSSLFNRFGASYRVMVVGDAQMAPSELMWPGGCLEFINDVSGYQWLQEWKAHYPKLVWLNPEPEKSWKYSETTHHISDLLDERMFPLSLKGLKAAIKKLKH